MPSQRAELAQIVHHRIQTDCILRNHAECINDVRAACKEEQHHREQVQLNFEHRCTRLEEESKRLLELQKEQEKVISNQQQQLQLQQQQQVQQQDQLEALWSQTAEVRALVRSNASANLVPPPVTPPGLVVLPPSPPPPPALPLPTELNTTGAPCSIIFVVIMDAWGGGAVQLRGWGEGEWACTDGNMDVTSAWEVSVDAASDGGGWGT